MEIFGKSIILCSFEGLNHLILWVVHHTIKAMPIGGSIRINHFANRGRGTPKTMPKSRNKSMSDKYAGTQPPPETVQTPVPDAANVLRRILGNQTFHPRVSCNMIYYIYSIYCILSIYIWCKYDDRRYLESQSSYAVLKGWIT